MKKLFVSFLLIALFVTGVVVFSVSSIAPVQGQSIEQTDDTVWTDISCFVGLTRIGRPGGYPSNGNFRLVNDIRMPYPGQNRPTNEAQANSIGLTMAQVNEFTGLLTSGNPWDTEPQVPGFIPDYFHRRGGLPATSRHRGWRPVDFHGTLDGQGYSIFGLAGDRGATGGPGQQALYNGLFRNLHGTVRNLNLEVGADQAGRTLIGGNAGAIVPHVHLTAQGQGGGIHNTGIGGVATQMSAGSLVDNVTVTSANGTHIGISGGSMMGGIVGFMVGNATLRNSFVRATVGFAPNGSMIGGAVGLIEHGGLIENVGSVSDVWGHNDVGGLVGSNFTTGVVVRNSFSGGTVRGGANQNTASFMEHAGSTTFENNFTFTTRHPDSPGGTSFRQFSGRSSWGTTPPTFTNNWVIGEPGIGRASIFGAGEGLMGILLAQTIGSDVFNTSLFIDHVLNAGGYNVFVESGTHADADIIGDNAIGTPVINRNPIAFPERINIVTLGQVGLLNGSALFAGQSLSLLPGDYLLEVEFLGETFSASFVIENRPYDNNEKHLFFVEYRTRMGELVDRVLVGEGFDMGGFPPPNDPIVFVGWYTDRFVGEPAGITSGTARMITLFARHQVNRIAGQITVTGPSSVGDIFIEILDPTDMAFVTSIFVDTQGYFVYENLQPGDYRLRVKKDGFLSVLSPVWSVEMGVELTMLDTINLSSAVVLSVTAPQNSTAIIRDMNGRTLFQAALGFTAAFTFGSIDNLLLDGDYFLIFERAGHRQVNIPFTVDRESITINHTTMSPVTISGTTRAGATVNLIFADVIVQTTVADADGNFTFYQVYNRTYRVESIFAGYNTEISEVTVVNNSDAEVHFNMDNPLMISGRTRIRTTVQLWQDDVMIASVTVDAFGEYSFRVDGNGTFRLVFIRANYDTEEITTVIQGASVRNNDVLAQRTPPEMSPVVGQVIQALIVAIMVGAILYALFGIKLKRKNSKE
ncbi:MAG: hypothetical protein FWE38_02495 [Firmicutes bacterium]|nr:hypothetical protein [Bacillota bacterium]